MFHFASEFTSSVKTKLHNRFAHVNVIRVTADIPDMHI